MKVTNSTPLINVDTQEYPVYLPSLRALYTSVSFPETVDLELIEHLGYQVVEHVVMPAGDVVTEGAPELVDGVWKRTWNVRSHNAAELSQKLTERKNTLLKDLKEMVTYETEVGFPYSIVEGETFHVQLRMEDRINLIALKGEADAMIAAQMVDLMEFRPYENISVFLTAQQMSTMAGSALVAMKNLYKNSWIIKDQVIAAVSEAELPDLPATLF